MPSRALASAKLAASLVWELPQCLLGAAVLGVARASGQVCSICWDQGRVFVRTRGIGISLGLFVFWFEEGNRYFRADTLMRRHEHGHTFQSRWLGPLYLLLVGVPSTMRAAYSVAYRELTGRHWTGYFDGYPESWADRLGGISVAERAAARSAADRA